MTSAPPSAPPSGPLAHPAGRPSPTPGPARRAFAALLPLLAWIALTAPLWGAIVAPWAVGAFLVAFAAYWLWRSAEFALGVLVGLWRLHASRRRNWTADLAALGPRHGRLRYLVLLPTYGESEAVLAETLRSLTHQTVPLDRVAVVLATEARDPHAARRAQALTASFASRFGGWLVTVHPDLPGEVRGKSSNLAWAARQARDTWVRTGRFAAEDLLVAVCDADSRLDPQLLAALGHAYLRHPDGRFHLYQPAILFYANHDRLPVPLRALASIFSLYSLARLLPAYRLVPQSTYALAWSAAEAVGFWDVDVIPEDSHMFFKVWLRLGDRVRTRPIYLPVYADAAEGHTVWSTVLSTYRQIRRWAWGVSDVPYVALGALRAPRLACHHRLLRVAWYVEEHLLWPTHWFLITLAGLPRLLHPTYAASPEGMWQVQATSTLFGLCLPALLVGAVADAWLRPRGRSLADGALQIMRGLVGFATLPLTGLLLVALPALDAHTRLLLGRSLAYQVTQKLPAANRGATVGADSVVAADAQAASGPISLKGALRAMRDAA